MSSFPRVRHRKHFIRATKRVGTASFRDRMAERRRASVRTARAAASRRSPTVHLGPLDRDRVATTFDQMAQSIAGYEVSAKVSVFTSKFDAVLAGKAQFAEQEQASYDFFRGRAQCNACHRDGGPGQDPLFTDFTASNIGAPRNPRLGPTMRKIGPTHWAMSLIRQGRRSSMAASAIFSPRDISSASPPQWMRDGSSWRRATEHEFRCQHCAMWTSGPI